MSGVSGALHTLLADPAFLASIPLSFETVLPLASATGEKADSYEGNKPLHLILLESGPDFVHVVSLKGAFLYVAPAVRRVLGYAPEDLVGHSIAEFCHPADVVPLMRELKESSVAGAPLMQENGPRKVDLLFRMSTKAGRMVWVECRGRLHIEPGKGRKAIILSGRVRSMPTLTWGPVERAGGLSAPVPGPSTVAQGENATPDTHVEVEREFWAMLSANGTFLFAGAAVRDVLGWGVGEVIGRTVSDFIGGAAPTDAQRAIEDEVARVCSAASNAETRSVSCEMKRKDGAHVPVQIVLYRSLEETDASAWLNVPSSSSPSSSSSAPAPYPVVCQIKAFDPVSLTLPRTSRIVHPLQESIYDEMHVSRGSSWQYELQQLKYANQRMVEEVASLETAIQTARARQPSLPPAQAHHIPVAQQRRALSYTQEIQSLQYIHPPRVGLLGHNGEEWRPQLAPYQEPRATVPNMNRLPVKRAWDDPERGDPS